MADHRAAGRSREPAVGQKRNVVLVALPDDRGGDTEHLAHPGAPLRALVTDHEHVAGFDVALLDVPHRRLLALEDPRGPGVVELVIAGDFQDRAVGREVAGEDLDRARLLVGVVDGVDELAGDFVVVGEVELVQLLGDRPAGDGHRVAVDESGVEKPADHDRHAALPVEVVHRLRPARLEVRDLRRPFGNFVELLDREVDPGLGGEREQVQHRVGGAADRDLQRDGVLEGLLREDVGGAEVVLDGPKHGLAGAAGDVVPGVGLGGCVGGAERRQPQRLGDRRHRVGGEHPAAGPRAGAGVTLQVVEFVGVHLPLCVGADALEDVLDGDVATLVFAGHDRPAVEEHRGQIRPDRRHHHPGKVLVAARDGHQGVQPLAERDEFDGVGDHLPGDQ